MAQSNREDTIKMLIILLKMNYLVFVLRLISKTEGKLIIIYVYN